MGFGLAIMLAEVRTMVDFRTGNVRTIYRIGPFVVDDKVDGDRLFDAYVLAINSSVDSPQRQWRQVGSRRLWEFYSSQTEGEIVLRNANRLAALYWRMGPQEAKAARAEFLRLLNQEGVSASSRFVDQAEERWQVRM